VHLKETLQTLARLGLLEAKFATRPGVSSEFKLTEKGRELAQKLWRLTPIDVKTVIVKVKENLYAVDTTQLKHIIHKKYPEYRKIYVENDAE